MALMNQAALLDELFGVDRNSTVKKEITWDDESICKYYLAGFCPHDLFVNTKMSLGACPKVHDSKLYEAYKSSSQLLRMGYERRLKSFLQRYVDDVKKKIVYNVERMENGLLSGTEVGIQKRITALEREINELVRTIEVCGNEGRIEECRNLNCELEEKQKTLKYDRIELETQRRNTRERLEEVCSTCGAYISKNDPRNSLENHVSGRIHCSYVKINEVLNELNETLIKAEKDSMERRISRDRSRESSRIKHTSRESKHESVKRSRDRSSESKHKSHKKRSHRSRSYSHGKDNKHRDRREDYDRPRSRKEDDDRRKERREDNGKRKERKDDDKRKEKYYESDTRKYRKEDYDKRNEKTYEIDEERKEKKYDRKDKSWGEI